MMNSNTVLVRVTGRPFRAVCLACSRQFHAGDVVATDNLPFGGFADVNGKAFVAYYCEECGVQFYEQQTREIAQWFTAGGDYTADIVRETKGATQYGAVISWERLPEEARHLLRVEYARLRRETLEVQP